MKRSRLLSMLLIAAMLLTALTPAAAQALEAADSTVTAIVPDAGDGVALEYDEADFSIRTTEFYGLIKSEENKTLVMTARFDEGWTYCADFSNFFRGYENVTETANADGSVTFEKTIARGEMFAKDDLVTIGVYASAAELPKLEIQAEVPFSQIGKEEYVAAEYTLTLGTKQFASGDYSGTGEIKGRGNTSWGQPKKPYSIKLEKKASLLDIPKTKKYAIIPGYSDDSMVRNYMTYKASLQLAGIDYVPKCEFVEVYLNGTYNGIYLLVERVSLESNKIDIEEATAEELTGGYLIEKDIDGKIDFSVDQWFNCPYWANQSHDYFVLKEPEPEEAELKEQMLAYLEDYMQSVHNAITGSGSEPYTKYVDVDSWADFMIIQEIAKNIDGNLKTSCYLEKRAQDDKLYLTAPWDFDLAYGSPDCTWNNADWTHNDYYDCPGAQDPADFMVINSSCPWFDHLYDDYEEFRSTLIERYRGYRESMIPDMLRIMNRGTAYIANAMPRDEGKWGVRFEAGVEQLHSWFVSRIEWLDSQWGEPGKDIDLDYALNTEGGHLSFTSNGNYPFSGTVKDGRVAAVSGNAGHDSSNSTLTLTLDMEAGQTLAFDYKISSESGYDKLKFSVNGSQTLEQSGERDWTTYTYTADSAGSYTFVWKYEKDYSYAAGSDCVWIDEVIWSGDTAGLPGDVDGNGVVDSQDALLTLRFALGIIDSLPVERNADVSGDGVIDSQDALIILRMALGIIG